MTERKATFFICDELLVSLNGKFTISGMYVTDLVIATEPAQLIQLVILVQVETIISKPFRSLIIHVQLPGEAAPRIMDASAMIPPVMSPPGRSNIRMRIPFLISQPVLRAGPIEVKVIHEEGELLAGRQWVLSVAQDPGSTCSLRRRPSS
jgi:hypothetical protein